MDGWEWTKIGGAVSLACGALAGAHWFAGLLMAPVYPQERGYGVEGVPPVDLAQVQRSWPGGAGRPGDRDLLLGYISHIERAKVPVPAGAVSAGPAEPMDLGSLLAAADPARGQRVAQVCASCHTFEQGGAHRVGPNLFAVVGDPVGGRSGFSYSHALEAHGGRWTYPMLDDYLARPNRAIPGNRMAFNGIRNPRDRADLIAYLAEITPDPPPFPEPERTHSPAEERTAS